jgi:putative transposase
MITDKLGSYAAARRQIMPAVEHRSHKRLNNRAENSHLPLRKRERAMQGFRTLEGLQRFASVFSAVRNLFVPLAPGALPLPPTFTAPTQRRGDVTLTEYSR